MAPLGVLCSHAMAAVVRVDTNAGETPLFTALHARLGAEQVVRERLDVGDVVLTSAEGVSVLVERKTYADWGKSVTDGTPSKTVFRLGYKHQTCG